MDLVFPQPLLPPSASPNHGSYTSGYGQIRKRRTFHSLAKYTHKRWKFGHKRDPGWDKIFSIHFSAATAPGARKTIRANDRWTKKKNRTKRRKFVVSSLNKTTNLFLWRFSIYQRIHHANHIFPMPFITPWGKKKNNISTVSYWIFQNFLHARNMWINSSLWMLVWTSAQKKMYNLFSLAELGMERRIHSIYTKSVYYVQSSRVTSCCLETLIQTYLDVFMCVAYV